MSGNKQATGMLASKMGSLQFVRSLSDAHVHTLCTYANFMLIDVPHLAAFHGLKYTNVLLISLTSTCPLYNTCAMTNQNACKHLQDVSTIGCCIRHMPKQDAHDLLLGEDPLGFALS